MKRIFFAKIENKTVFALFCFLGAIFVLFSACGALPEGAYFPQDPFWVEAEGEIDGEQISVKVFCDPTDHMTKEIYNKLTVTFSAPKSLEGMTVSLRSDGKATIRLKNSEEELPLYSEIAEPYLALCPDGEYSSVKKTKQGYLVVYENESDRISYVFDNEGQPKSAEGEFLGHKISLNITKIYENSK